MKKISILFGVWQGLSAMEPSVQAGATHSKEATLGASKASFTPEDSHEKQLSMQPKTLPSYDNGFQWLQHALQCAYMDKKGTLGCQFQDIDVLILMQGSVTQALGFLAQQTYPSLSPLYMEKLGITAHNTDAQNFASLKAIYRKPKCVIFYKK